MLTATIGFAGAFALIFNRIPIAVSLIIAGFVGFAFLTGVKPAFLVVANAARDSVLSYNLVIIPLFVLMGNFIAGTGISAELFRAAQMTVGRRRGGLGLATVLSCGAFGAVCGSSVLSD